MDMRGTAPGRTFLVIEGRHGATGRQAGAVLASALADAEADGWNVLRGWAAPMRRDRIVCTGWIRSSDDARRALLAAVSGARLAVGISADRDTVDRFLDDLRRLGPVDHVPLPAEPGQGDPRHRALLALLSEGLTVGEAATELGITRRTAERRIADSRRSTGAVATQNARHRGASTGS